VYYSKTPLRGCEAVEPSIATLSPRQVARRVEWFLVWAIRAFTPPHNQSCSPPLVCRGHPSWSLRTCLLRGGLIWPSLRMVVDRFQLHFRIKIGVSRRPIGQ